MNLQLTGKTVLITGASKGIGLAAAHAFANEGCHLHLAARSADALADAKASITAEYGVNVTIHVMDLGLSDNIVSLAQAAAGCDILINNAAVTFFIPIETFPPKRFDLMVEVQVWAALHLSQLVLPSMQAKKSGAIVSISSGAAIHPKKPYEGVRPGGTVYGMCKAAIERFSTGLASEVYADNISVNAISPGLVATPGVAVHGLITEATKHRVSPIEHIAEAVYQIVSGDPKVMTGRIDHAGPFLEEFGITASALV